MKETFEFFHNVPTGFFVMYPQQALNVAQFSHKPSKNSQRAQWAHCDQIDGHIVKEQRGFIQKVPTGFCAGYFLKVPTTYLLGMSWANWWALFENDQYVPAGYFAG